MVITVRYLNGDEVRVEDEECSSNNALKVILANAHHLFVPNIALFTLPSHDEIPVHNDNQAPPRKVACVTLPNLVYNDEVWSEALIKHAAQSDDDGVARALHVLGPTNVRRVCSVALFQFFLRLRGTGSETDIENELVVRTLIKAECDVNYVADNDRRTLLHRASERGWTNVVHQLLDARADVNRIGWNDEVAVRTAAVHGHIECATLLIAARAEVNLSNEYEDVLSKKQRSHTNRLHYLTVVIVLIKASVEVNCAGKQGRRPLHIACEHGCAEVVKLLLQARAQVNSGVLHTERTALHLASMRNAFMEVKTILREADLKTQGGDADDNGTNRAGADEGDALMKSHRRIAEKKSRTVEIVQMLLDAHAEVNAYECKSQHRALHMACQSGHVEVVQLLLRADADTNGKETNITALHLALRRDALLEIHALLYYMEQIRGTVIQEHDVISHPLVAAYAQKQVGLVTLLLEAKANPNSVDHMGQHVLHDAASIPRPQGVDLCNLLLDAHANIDHTVANGPTALHLACSLGHREIVLCLLAARACVDIKASDDPWGNSTPLYSAASNNHADICHLLLRARASINAARRFDVPILNKVALEGYDATMQVLLAFDHAILLDRASLILAAEQGHAEIVQLYFKKSSTKDVRAVAGALRAACENGRVDIVRILVGSSDSRSSTDDGSNHVLDVNIRATYNGYSALHAAAERGMIDIVRLLCDANADVNACYRLGGICGFVWGTTPLHIACVHGHAQLVPLLCAAHAEVNARAGAGNWFASPQRALDIACARRDTDVIQALITERAAVNGDAYARIWPTWWTPLQNAAHRGHDDVVKLLLRGRADVAEANLWKRGKLARTLAAHAGHARLSSPQTTLNSGTAVPSCTKQRSPHPFAFGLRKTDLPIPLYTCSFLYCSHREITCSKSHRTRRSAEMYKKKLSLDPRQKKELSFSIQKMATLIA